MRDVSKSYHLTLYNKPLSEHYQTLNSPPVYDFVSLVFHFLIQTAYYYNHHAQY